METEQYTAPGTRDENLTTEEFRETLDNLPEDKKAEVKDYLVNGEIGRAIDEIFAARRTMEVGKNE